MKFQGKLKEKVRIMDYADAYQQYHFVCSYIHILLTLISFIVSQRCRLRDGLITHSKKTMLPFEAIQT